MLKRDVKMGKVYAAMVSGRLSPVRVDCQHVTYYGKKGKGYDEKAHAALPEKTWA